MKNFWAIMTFFCISLPINAALKNNNFDDSNQKAILEGINDYRLQHGLNPLKMDDYIIDVAKAHSQDMADSKIPFGHAEFNTRMSQIFARFHHSQGISENVAFTSEDPKTVVKMWLDSQGHRKNIEGNYNLTGIGIAHDSKGASYVTEIFLNNG